MDPSLVYRGPYASEADAKSARWMLLFPLEAAERVYHHRPEPGDLETLRAAIVQGVLEDLRDAFTWRDIVNEKYPEG